MVNCRTCNFLTCKGKEEDGDGCNEYEPYEEFEAYTFNERTGSENIHTFHSAEARDAFVRRQPQHKMAH